MSSANQNNGSKYLATKDLRVVEIAKLVRADIAGAIARGILPVGMKVSVRYTTASMCQSIDLRIVSAPAGYVVKATESEAEEARAARMPKPWLTRPAAFALSALERIVEAYNFNRTDCRSVRFFSNVTFDLKSDAVAA